MEIGRTLSVCPVCLSRIPAKKLLEADGIYMEKKCPDHGTPCNAYRNSRDSHNTAANNIAYSDHYQIRAA